MVTLASRFFAEREALLDKADTIDHALGPRQTIQNVFLRLRGISRLPGRPEGPLQWFYRGQSDAGWGISSALYRVVREAGPVSEVMLARAEQRVLEEMRKQGLGHNMNDGQLLMVPQHHGIPTRLIDVSKGWLPALWFATEHSDTTDGRLFLIGIRSDANGGHPSINLGDEAALPWEGAAIGRAYSSRSWSESVMSVADPSLDPRMQAQRGCFLVGGLTRRYEGENWPVGGRMLPAAQWPDISALRIFLPQAGAKKRAGARWPAVAWTIRISGSLKPELREVLRKRHYTADHMYPDFDGSRRLGSFIARQSSQGVLRRGTAHSH